MPDVYIRKAQVADLGMISSLAEHIWWKHYPGIISNAQIRYMLDKIYSLQALNQQLTDGQDFHLLIIEGKALAFAGISGKGDHFFLHKLYCSSEEYRRMGSLLLNYLIMSYPQMKKLELRVNRNNSKAIAFYLKNGFQILNSHDLEIGDGFLMEDYLMEKKISP